MILVVGTIVGVLALVLGAYWLFVLRNEAGEHRALQGDERETGAERGHHDAEVLDGAACQ